jgi:hypothetical protein
MERLRARSRSAKPSAIAFENAQQRAIKAKLDSQRALISAIEEDGVLDPADFEQIEERLGIEQEDLSAAFYDLIKRGAISSQGVRYVVNEGVTGTTGTGD